LAEACSRKLGLPLDFVQLPTQSVASDAGFVQAWWRERCMELALEVAS
jgi:hypothetical protein